MRVRAVILAAALALAPLGARAADLVVWWEEGFNPEEDAGGPRDNRRLRAEDRQAGRARLPSRQEELPDEDRWRRSRPATRPTSPSAMCSPSTSRKWALDGRLVDLSEPLGPLTGLFDPDALDRAVLLNASDRSARPLRAADRALEQLRPRLEEPARAAGFTLADIPKEWEAFWSFWCDKVQPAVRRATGRDDIYGVGLPMSARAYRHLVRVPPVRERLRGRLRDPRRQAGHRRSRGPGRLVEALDGYTDHLPQGLHPARLGGLGRRRATTRHSWRRRW